MKRTFLFLFVSLLSVRAASADGALDELKRELEALKRRVVTLEENNAKLRKQIDVERLIVRKELVVSDTGQRPQNLSPSPPTTLLATRRTDSS